MEENENLNIQNEINQLYKTTLPTLVEIIKGYQRGEVSDKALDKFGNELMIRSYIPMEEKVQIAVILITKALYVDEYSNERRVANLYKNLFFYGLLQGYAFINCTEYEEYCTYENYDVLFPIMYKFISGYCKDDYEVLKSFVNDSINFYRIEDLIDRVSMIDPEALEKANTESKNLIKEIENNQTMISDLKDILMVNDETTKSIVEGLKKTAQENAIKKGAELQKKDEEINNIVALRAAKKELKKDSQEE